MNKRHNCPAFTFISDSGYCTTCGVRVAPAEFDPSTMTRATPADIQRIWEQCWGVVSLPTSDWAMLEGGELIDLWQIEHEVI